MGEDRRRRPSIARHVAMYLAIIHLNESTAAIGTKFDKDRTICSYAKSRITNLLQTDPGMVEVIRAIEGRLFS
jgi:chromosomal replication initiation ATPase DnaA